MSVTYSVSGRNVKGGAVKTMVLLQVAIKVDDSIPFKSQKSDLEVYVEGPEEVKPSILGGERGSFHVGFTPNVGGQFWFDFVYKGTVANEPFLLPVKDMFGKVTEVPYKGKCRTGGSASGSAGKVDDSAERLRREEERKREEEERIQREMEEKMRKEEEDRIRREEEERKRKEDEERLRREEEERNRIEGQISAITFIFHALNRNGEPKTTGGDTDAFEVTSNGEKITMIEDAGDGTYTVDYNCVPGINEVDVKYKGQSIKGFPVVFSI